MTHAPADDPVIHDAAAPIGLSAAAGAAESAWIATLAHELRGPLWAVQLALNELRDVCGVEPAAREAREAAERGSRHMARVIEDVLDLCRGAHGKLTVRRDPIDVADVVAGAVAVARPLLAARRVTLAVSVPPRPPVLEGQASRVQQVLTNLLANAAKFTAPGGHVELAVEAHGGSAVFRVRDDGIGIAPDLLPHVFEAYRQGTDRQGAGRHGGLGVGLAVVKALVELHGGTVTAHSDGHGAGAEFVVRLPACDAAPHATRAWAARSLSTGDAQ